MKNHSKYAGNFGDVVKKILLPELTYGMSGSYVETHAGFPVYTKMELSDENGQLNYGRPLGMGYMLRYRPIELRTTIYGRGLLNYRLNGIYRGSLLIVREASRYGYNTFRRFYGFDVNQNAVNTFEMLEKGDILVQMGDGYEGYKNIENRSVVFCDPFWEKHENIDAIRELITSEPSIVWYPIRSNHSAQCRKFFEHERKIGYIELSFVDPAWDGEGYGMAFAQLPYRNFERAAVAARQLMEKYGIDTVNGIDTNIKMCSKIPR